MLKQILLCEHRCAGGPLLRWGPQHEGLHDEGPADGAVLEVRYTLVAHTCVSAGQQNPVHSAILTDDAVSGRVPRPVLLLFLAGGLSGGTALLWVGRNPVGIS